MERLTERKRNFNGTAISKKSMIDREGYPVVSDYASKALTKLADYEDAEEQGLLLRLPCKVGDTVYLIDRDENNKLKVYEGKWERVSLVQTSKDGSFNLCGEISYDIYDCFYNDGRIMKHGMYVGQERTKIGKVVFLTKEEAEAKLKEMEGAE